MIKTAIEYYESFAEEYDSLSKKHEWHSPEVLFGLVFKHVKNGEKLLDLGIGTGQSAILFKQAGLRVYGADGSKNMLKKCETKQIAEELKEFDLNEKHFPYEDESFDHVIANGTLYFFKDLEHFFAEAKRILKNGGTFSFAIEDLKTGYSAEYVNKSNNTISERLIEKVGVKVYRHAHEYIEKLIKKHGFTVLKKLEYFAYNSPTENRGVYFKAYVLKKK